MKQFERGQIWLVNFNPSFGHEYKKIRPALIIQNSRYIKPGHLLTVIPISSQVEKQAELDILIVKDSQNRLMTDSLLKTRQISSFDNRRLIKLVGTLNEKIMGKVGQNIQDFLI